MTTYYYKHNGKVYRINLAPSEYNRENQKHTLYNTELDARRAKPNS